MARYTATEKSITCHTCGLTSFNPHDVEQRYCGHCHVWHDLPRHYTHRDSQGVLWRFVGARPISEIADAVMDGITLDRDPHRDPIRPLLQPPHA